MITTTDLIVQRNIRRNPIVLIQEGMTDPEALMFHLCKHLGLPRYLASTATMGLSDAYQVFCVASEGYRDLFIRKGVRPEKIAVTGIPNFDNAARFYRNRFPYRGYVLVATSDTRETFKRDDRERFIRRALEIAAGRPLIFKLHPNENFHRSYREIQRLAPRALVLAEGNTGEMIANCDVLITQYSSVAFIGLALGKEVHSYFDVEELKRLLPIQNGGTSHRHIAAVCHRFEREHTTPYLWEQPERFRVGNVAWETGRNPAHTHRWTLDYHEDYLLIQAIFEVLYPTNPLFGLADILALLERRPELMTINRRHVGVTWYRHHLHELRTVGQPVSQPS